MLCVQAKRPHVSFHTPGHKQKGWDITELSYSDNLSCPRSCIAEAEKDISKILGAEKSFLLTDGSTSGVFSILHAAKSCGVKTVAFCEAAHKSVYNACSLLGLSPLIYPQKTQENIPFAYTMAELQEKYEGILSESDALLLTSPDYYGNIPNLSEFRKYCDENKKLLLIDGAHGGHLHFHKDKYAGAFADLWVDGVHKSLPALTQGAVCSARTEALAEKLSAAVDVFRTTSPSYPIMASVEYAVKYPRNEEAEQFVHTLVKGQERIFIKDDWTKVCVRFGKNAFNAEKDLEQKGIYSEFCDGNVIMFYLSPLSGKKQLTKLKKALKELFEKYPYNPLETSVDQIPAPSLLPDSSEVEWLEASKCVGRVSAGMCGLFPPCTPLFNNGDRITEEKLRLLKEAANVFGVKEGKLAVYADKEKDK